MVIRPRDLRLARRARRHGARYSLRIIWEARRAGIPITLAFAIVQQESDFRNVIGHDPGGLFPGMRPTPARVLAILRARVSNGIGLTQLTWKPYIVQAQRLGGAWVPRNQLRVGFRALAALIREKGTWDGIRAYNGTGPAAARYANTVLVRQRRWRQRLDP